MTSTTRYKAFLILTGSLLLAACATTQPPGTTGRSETASTPASTASSTASAPLSDGTPSVLIRGRSSKAVLDDIVQYRTQQKGMKLKSRSSTRLEFTLPIQRTATPTEARMSYLLVKEGDGLRLSARVFQFSYPGTTRETGQDVTQSMSDKLQEELQRYLQPAGAKK